MEAEKIDGLSLETFKIIIDRFEMIYKLGIARFFQAIFLLAETSTEVVLGIPFFTLINMDI